MGQAKKYEICTKYFGARRKNAIFAKILNPNLQIKSIGCKGICTASIVPLQNCFGPGEKVLYLHKVLLGQSKKYKIWTKYFWARRKNTKFALSTFGPGKKVQYLQKISIRIYTSNSIGFKGIFFSFHCAFAKLFWARRKSAVFALSTFGPGEKIQYLH